MSLWLKQSTTVTVKVGPFLDDTDGKTPETGLTVAVELSKNGGAFAARNSATATSHDAEGFYAVELNATDTGTAGRLLLKSVETGALPVWHEYMVLPAATYDALVTNGLNNLSAAQVNTEADTALADVGLTGTITGRIDAAISTRASQSSVDAIDDLVDTEVAAIKTVTDKLSDMITGSAPDYAFDATALANAPAGEGGGSLTAADVWDLADGVETGLTPRQALRLLAAALSGKLSGAASTTITIRNAVADSKARITATVDSDGNRSAITYDVS